MALKLYLDEDVDPYLATALRDRGFDVVSVSEAGLRGKTDREQLEYSASENRTLVTFNIRDFAKLHRQWQHEGKQHSGIIVSSQITKREFNKMLHRLQQLLIYTWPDEISNQLRYLQEFKE